MPQKRYIVRLTAQEREVCRETVRKLNGSSEKVRRAQVLLKADADGPAWTDQKIADAFSCRTKTVENIRQRCVLEGFEQALERKRREFPPVPKLLNGEQEAHIIALRLGPPPKGYANWSRRVHGRAAGAVGQGNPPRRWRPRRTVPGVSTTSTERAGTAAVFLFSEPLAGWRQATARARRTKVDWALEVAGLLEGRYADCEKITLVCDHLNTHTKGAFYQVFEPARARELVRRIEFCHTPKHGSWLNIAENELSSMTRQCVRGRRIGDLGTLHDEVSAWSTDVNGTQRGVDWQMKVDDARCKLKSVYPQIMT